MTVYPHARRMTPTELALTATMHAQQEVPALYGRHAPPHTPGRPISVGQLRARAGLDPWREGVRNA